MPGSGRGIGGLVWLAGWRAGLVGGLGFDGDSAEAAMDYLITPLM